MVGLECAVKLGVVQMEARRNLVVVVLVLVGSDLTSRL